MSELKDSVERVQIIRSDSNVINEVVSEVKWSSEQRRYHALLFAKDCMGWGGNKGLDEILLTASVFDEYMLHGQVSDEQLEFAMQFKRAE